jgi:hypothetical protein
VLLVLAPIWTKNWTKSSLVLNKKGAIHEKHIKFQYIDVMLI